MIIPLTNSMRSILLLLVATQIFAVTPSTVSPADPRIQIIGRVDRSDPDHMG
jgi:hypothetical protein